MKCHDLLDQETMKFHMFWTDNNEKLMIFGPELMKFHDVLAKNHEIS